MIKRRDDLLQQLAAQLNKNNNNNKNIGTIGVALVYDEDIRFEFGLAEAIDVLANNLYWDERGDWSEATIVEVFDW